jgi:hypothetical protein
VPLTDDELGFLSLHGFNREDVHDGRHQSKSSREEAAKREGKPLILTSVVCRAAGHRIRTRGGHCFQCNPLRLVYQIRHGEPAFVYVAGSLTGQLIKIGSAGDIPTRQRKLRYDQYAGFADWKIMFSVWANEAGKVESDASARIADRRTYQPYFKDGVEQVAVEAFRCRFSTAVKAVKESLGPKDTAVHWKALWTYPYEFDYE